MKGKKRYIWGLINLMCALALLACGCTVKDPSGNTTLRITKDFKENELFYLENELCTTTEAKVLLMNQKNLYSDRYGKEIWEARYNGQPLYSYLEEDLRDFMIQLKCMVLMAAANEISLSPEDNTLITLAAKQYYEALSKSELAYCGGSYLDIEKTFADYYLANKLYRVLTAGATKEISDDEARVITVQMIYLPFGETYPVTGASSSAAEDESEGGTGVRDAAAMIEELHHRATQGEEDFLGLAQSYSRGDWTERQICRGEMEAAFEEAAFALSKGVISKVVTGENGYYIIKCVNNYVTDLTAIHREELINEWKQDMFQTAYNAFVGDLYLRFNEPEWLSIDFAAVPDSTGASFYASYDEFLGR